MAKNSAAAKARKAANLEFFSEFMESFAGEYDIELKQFGVGIHWRLENGFAMLDVWPTTGKYYIKELPLGRGFAQQERSGIFSQDYEKLDTFFKALFVIK